MKKLMNLIAVALCAASAQAAEFDYDVNVNGTVTLNGVKGIVPADLVIPSEIAGRTVTGIGQKFCEECDSLRSVKFPDSIRTVADHSFDECGKLKSVELNEGLLEIGRKAFCECPIETLVLPSTLRSIGNGAFTRSNIPGPLFSKSTSGLKSISIRHGDNLFFETCNGNGLYDKQEKRLIFVSPYATSIRVPDGCERIGETALLCCGNLTSITFPDSLTEIDDEAFASCVKLTNLDFSKTRLGRVSEQAFCGCVELVSVSFPDTLSEIGGGAFCGANKLQSVSFQGNAPYVNVDYEETSGKWGDLYIAIRNFMSGDNWVYDGYIKTVSTYVKEGTSGWGEVPGTWQHRPIQYIGLPITPAIDPSYGPFVPGEMVSLAIPALVGYTAKGLPSGLKLNKKTGEISGGAKMPTGEAGVTVTFTKKNEPTLTAQFIVGPIPTISVTLEGDTEKCKVTGANKAYLVGKKVSLQANGPKGTAFVGWFKDGEPWPSEEVSKNAKLSYVMTKESLALVARFEKEKMRVACPVLAASSFTVGVAGGAAGIPIEIETRSGVKSVAVSKLPSGMKYDKKTGLIVGAPTKAGSFNVTIKVTAKSGAVETLVVPVTVAALPDWAVGTFVGLVRQVAYDAQGNVVVDGDGRHDWYDGELTVTVSAKGKISGKLKLPDDGGTGSFAFPAFASCDEGGCIASGSMKLGKSLKMDVELQIRERTLTEGASNLAGDLEIRMRGTEDSLTVVFSTDENRPLRQQVWKSKTLPLPPSIDKKSVALEQDGLLYTLSFGKSGAVSDVLASADNPKKAIVKGKPVFSVVGYRDAAWHCELFGTPVVDMADGGEERLRFDVRITDDGSLICARSEKTF